MPTSVPTSTGHPAPTDPIRTIMIDAPATVGPEESLLSVAQELVAGEIGAVLVVAAGAPTGLVSERDIVTVAASGGDLAREQAGDVMTTDLVTAAPGDSIAEVAALMRERVRDRRRRGRGRAGCPAGAAGWLRSCRSTRRRPGRRWHPAPVPRRSG